MTDMQKRTFTADVTKDNGVLRVSISSEKPYLRGKIGGHRLAYEVLGHRPGEINMENMVDSPPFLFEHKTDVQVGAMENISLDADGRLRADILPANGQFASDIYKDMRDGIRKRTSIGYTVSEYSEVGDINGIPVLRATKWTPFEASTCSIPADMSVGVGKGLRARKLGEDSPMYIVDDAQKVVQMILGDGTVVSDPADIAQVTSQLNNDITEDSTMATGKQLATDDNEEPVVPVVEDEVKEDEQEVVAAEVASDEVVEDDEVKADGEEQVVALADAIEDVVETIVEEVVDDEEVPSEGAKSFDSSATTISIKHTTPASQASFKEHKIMNKNHISALTELAKRHNALDSLSDWIAEGRTVESVKAELLDSKSNAGSITGAPAIHTKKKESFGGAVTSFLRGENSELAERGLDQARLTGRSVSSNVLYIPTNVDMIPARYVRAGTAYTNTGVNATGKEYFSFEETLREGSKLSTVGGQIITLNDLASMPYFSAPATASMFHESGSSTDSEVTVGLRNWTPKRVSARYVFTNLLGRLNGTYDFEGELYTDLMAEGIRQIDAQAWAGTGTNNVTGLVNDSSIPAYTSSGSFNLAGATAMWSVVAKNNGGVEAGDMNIVVATTPYANCMATGAFAAGSGVSALQQIKETVGPVTSTNYFSTLSGGTLYQAVGGKFDKVTLTTFGPIEIKRDDLTLSQTGQTVLQLETFIDCVARQPGSLVRWSVITG